MDRFMSIVQKIQTILNLNELDSKQLFDLNDNSIQRIIEFQQFGFKKIIQFK